MTPPFKELPGLRVNIDQVVYMPDLDAPADRPHPFVYFLTIVNESDETVTIKGRKWVVTDEENNKLVVEGDGVVGRFPRLEPGESFSYNSCHVIATDSAAEGALIGLSEDGIPVIVRIPRFTMDVPE